MGYYPTPGNTQEILSQILTPGPNRKRQGKLHLIDPCCGEGVALAAMGKALREAGSDMCTYGCELDEERAARSSRNLDIVVAGSTFDLQCSKACFGLLWLNPPYDSVSLSDRGSQRLEVQFFNRTNPYLAPGGVIVLIVPLHVISSRFAAQICAEYEDLRIYKLPGKEYETFHQVVVLASKKEIPKFDVAQVERLIRTAESAAQLPEHPDFHYEIPFTKGPRYFRDSNPTIKEASKDLSSSTLEKDISALLDAPILLEKVPTLMPVKIGHLATLLTAGCVNGLVEKNGRKILVKGYAHRVTTTQKEQLESKVKVKEIEHTTVGIRFFDESGQLFDVT